MEDFGNIVNLEETNKENNIITIQTHDKRFHADDVGAISLLTCYFSQKGMMVHLIRSRDPELLITSNILVDVGYTYDPENAKFDHHQEGCNVTYSNKTDVPMSSIGMVWKHYGKEILSLYVKSNGLSEINNYDELCHEIYVKIIQEIDAHDNAIRIVKQSGLNIISIISAINNHDVDNENDQMDCFKEAISLFGKVFEIKLKDIIRKYQSHHINVDKVRSLLENTNEEYLIINENIETIYKSLDELDPFYTIKFLIFTHDPNEITLKTRFKPKICQPIIPLLPETNLKKELGDELIFVHKSLFLAKTKTLDAALKVIKLSIEGAIKNKRVSEEISPSYLKVTIPRVSSKMMKLGVMSGITLGCLGGILFYRTYLD